MIKVLLPILLLVLAGVLWAYWIDPLWNGPLVVKTVEMEKEMVERTTGGVKALRAYRAELKRALERAEELNAKVAAFDEVLAKISKDDRERLDKFLPSAVDSVQLIIDVNNIAKTHALDLKDVQVSTKADANRADQDGKATSAGLPPGVQPVTISFKTAGSYPRLRDFLTDLTRSLRLLELDGFGLSVGEREVNQYDLSLQTYWFQR